MVFLYILAGIILLIFLILMLRVRITVSYSKSPSNEGKPAVFLGIGPVRIKLYPKKEKKLKLSDYSADKFRQLMEADKAKKNQYAASEKKKDKKKDGEVLPGGIGEAFELISELVEKFASHLRCEVLKLRLSVGTSDAASTALTSAAVSSAVTFLLELIDNYTDMRLKSPKDVSVEPNYESSEVTGDIGIKFSIRVINILRAGKGFIMNYIRTLIRLDKQNESKNK